MVIVRMTMKALMEKRTETMQTLLSMIEPPANGNGLLSYGIYHDIEDSTVFNLISEWESRRHLNAHLSSDRFGVLLGTKSLLCKPIDVQILTITHVEGMEVVRTVRDKTGK